MYDSIFKKIEQHIELTKEDAVKLLEIQNNSQEYRTLISLADQFSRKQFKNKGTVFSQIGLDSKACSVNCKFCSLAKDSYNKQSNYEKSLDEVLDYTKKLIEAGTDELFLMTTADYNKEKFLAYAKAVKNNIPQDMKFVANTGDFDLTYAKKLKDIGFTGVYHICRLREGIDTNVKPETRINTLNNIRDAGLELYYCVEPIGPEHTNEEIVKEIFRAKLYPVGVMAVMKRVAVANTKLYDKGGISSETLAKIAAVTVLCVKPPRAMGDHEPDKLCLTTGVNQLYAEAGVNPRDNNTSTELSRGISVNGARKMLKNAGWK